MMQKRITVLGGGSFGTVLANMAAENGYNVSLWMRNQTLADTINTTRENSRYMPGYRLHPSLVATTNLQEAVADSSLILVSIPSGGFRSVLQRVKSYVEPEQLLVSTTKGLEVEGFTLMSEILAALFPVNPIGVLSGPNLAKEIAKKQLTATVIASADKRVGDHVQRVLANEYFRVYSSNDMYGVELAGTLKNIYAIISGLAAAMGMGENTKSMLITRSLAEMSRFAVSMGANPMTFIGLAGVGDLIVTCMSPLSRNYRVGYALGKGESLESAVSKLGEVAEGVNTIQTVKHKADELNIYMPLVSGLYEVLFCGLSIDAVIKTLMLGAQSIDVEFVMPK